MATGDQDDISARIIALVPTRWFADLNPIRDAIIAGAANALALVYSILQYVKAQTRIGTATDGFLDLISFDYFGGSFPRRSAEQDAPFRQRILANLLRERATRKGITDALVTLTGRAPDIFEPWRIADTGAYNNSRMGYNTAGRYGSLKLNNQIFVVAYRPSGSGLPRIAGYNAARGAYTSPSYAKYSSLGQVVGFVTDADIFAAVAAAKAAGIKAWVRLWSARLEMCQWRRETLDKESIWDEVRSTSLSRW
jgi:hypothetical protein